MGIMFKNPKFIRYGQAIPIEGTANSIGRNGLQGCHAWIEVNINGKNKIIDTSLMLVIPTELKEKIGYKNIKAPMSLNELLEYDDREEIYYEHYNVLSKYSTKNKASFAKYNECLREIKKDELSREEQR